MFLHFECSSGSCILHVLIILKRQIYIMFTTVIAWCNYAQDINYSPYLLYTSVHTYISLETEVLLLAAHDATAREGFPVEVLCPIHSK